MVADDLLMEHSLILLIIQWKYLKRNISCAKVFQMSIIKSPERKRDKIGWNLAFLFFPNSIMHIRIIRNAKSFSSVIIS